MADNEKNKLQESKGNDLAIVNQEIITSLVLNGDLSKMNEIQKVDYYNSFCRALQLNPLTQPFEIISLKGKLRMYARKDATDQLRKINGVSVTDLKVQQIGDQYVVIASGVDRTMRIDTATAVMSVKGLQGEELANAMMKCETKAKRRLTLSLCGLGVLDETEVENLTFDPADSRRPTSDMNVNSSPNAPAQSAMATEEDVKQILGLLNHGALGDMVFGKIKKEGMITAVNARYEAKTLEKHKAEEYIAGLKKEIVEAGGVLSEEMEQPAEEVPESEASSAINIDEHQNKQGNGEI